MPAQEPAIARFGERLCAFWSGFRRIILFDLTLVIEQIAHLADVEAGERGIEAALIQITQQSRQKRDIPRAADLVQRHVQGFFLLFVEIQNDAVYFGVSEMLQHFEPLVAADNNAGAPIPNDRLHIAELLDASSQLFKLRIAGLQIFPGIVLGRQELRYRDLFNVHTRPHSANFSKPPIARM